MSEVAEIFGVHPSTIKRWCVDGEIEFIVKGGIMFIPVEATESYEHGGKSKRVLMLEEQNNRLQEKIGVLEDIMSRVAGTLLAKGEM